MNVVGSHIKKLRKQRNLSQEVLAAQLNVTRQAVSQWENGNTQPDIDTLERSAKVFGVDILEVIYGEKTKVVPRLTPQQKKRYWIGFIGFGVLALALWVLFKQLQPTNIFDPKIHAWYYILYYAGPVFYILIPMSVLCGCSLVWDIGIRHRFIRLIILFVTLAFIVFYYGSSIIYISLNTELNIPSLIFGMLNFTLLNPAIFIFPGIGLFLGLNGNKAETKTQVA